MTASKKSAAFRMLAGLFVVLGLLYRCVYFGRSEKLWGNTFDVFAVNDRAYICAGGSLLALDVTDPSAIRLLGQLEISSMVKALRILGSYAIVAAGERGLRIIDTSIPRLCPKSGG